MRKNLILIFIALNIAAVLYSNQTATVQGWWQKPLREYWNHAWARGLNQAINAFGTYANYVGLNQQSAMFAGISRSTYRLVFTGLRDDGWNYPLPIELRPDRGFLNRNFFDHKAAKFHLNIMGNHDVLRRYAAYLCRTYQFKENPYIQSIQVQWIYREIRPREEALLTGFHFSPDSPAHVTQTQSFPCPVEKAVK